MMKSRPGRSRKLPLRVAIMLASLAAALGEDAPDFFDVIGKSPAEVAASMSGPYRHEESEVFLSSMVGTPMSREHRSQLLTELREAVKKKPAALLQILSLAKLLEEDGRYNEAVTLLRELAPEWKPPRVQEVSLLWKAGKSEEAEKLAAGIPNPSSLEYHWLSLVAVDLNKQNPKDAMRLLSFLESLVSLPPQVRHAFAIQHLSIARSTGDIDPLIASTASPVFRAVWYAALDRKAEALACVAKLGPSSSAGDIALLARALPGEAAVVEMVRERLRSDKLTTGDRLALLYPLEARHRVELWIDMPGGHEETAECVDPQKVGVESPLRERLLERCLEILKTQPGSTRLKWIAARLGAPEAPETKAMTREVSLTFRDTPEGAVEGADPARSALENLAKQSSPEELRELLIGSPDFANLSPPVRLRYLMTAKLDSDVVELIKASTLMEPGQDAMSASIRFYIEDRQRSQVVPDEVIGLLLKRLPELVLGSPEKKVPLINGDAGSWLNFFDPKVTDKKQLADAIQLLLDRAGQRSPDIRALVLERFPAFVWSLPGLQATRPQGKAATARPGVPEPYLASLFFPSDPTRIGQGERGGVMSMSLDSSFRASPVDGMRVLASSPWTQNLTAIRDRRQFDPVLQAKLRKLFDSQPSRTIIYDLLATSGKIECPDAGVKAAAEQRVATLVPSREEDPAIAGFLFAQQLLKKGATIDECLPLLDDLVSFPRAARARLLNSLDIYGYPQGLRRPQGDFSLIPEKLGFGAPAAPPEPPEAPDAYDRLQFFIEGHQEASPEAVKLAKDTLTRFVDSGSAETSPTENVSIVTLTTAQRFTEYLDELKARMKAAGKPEVDVQRALFRLHTYYIIHRNGESEAFAKRVFELDPTDRQAAWEVLGMAARKGDAALALKCLDVLARESPSRLAAALNPRDNSSGSPSSPGPLTLFAGERTRELADTLMRAPLAEEAGGMSDQSYNTPTLVPLYLHVARYDPEQLKPLMRWGRALSPSNAKQLLTLAEGLQEMNRDALALDLLDEALFAAAPDEATSQLRFPSKATHILPNLYNFPLPELASSGWAKRLTEATATRGEARADSAGGFRVLLALAADPRPDTWDRLVPPFIDSLPATAQQGARKNFEEQADRLTDAPELKLHLEELRRAGKPSPATLGTLQNKLQLANQANDRATIAAIWKDAEPLLEKARAPERVQFLTQATTGFARLAEPAAWSGFIAIAAKTEGFAKAWVNRHDTLQLPGISPDRVADVASVVMPTAKPDEQNLGTILDLFAPLATSASPDLELLKQFRPWIEESSRRDENGSPLGSHVPVQIQWLDLLSADLAAVCPVVQAHPDPDGSWTAEWSLAGFRNARQGFPSARLFPFLSGQFDVEILAGSHPERMKRVTTLPKANATGRVKLSLSAEDKFIAAQARQVSGDIVRMSLPVKLDPSLHGEPVTIEPKVIGNGSGQAPIEELGASAPFESGVALSILVPGGGEMELARLPWEEGAAPIVSGWFLQKRHAGSLRLSFRAADGRELESCALDAGEDSLDSLPFWRQFKTPANQNVPDDTASVALVFNGSNANEDWSIRIDDVRVVPPVPIQLPQGFTAIGRVPGSISQFALDPDGKRLVVGSHRAGVGAFDLSTGQFSGWIPLGPDREMAQLFWLAASGDRVVCADTSGEVHLVSLAKRSARMIRKTEDLTNFPNSGNYFNLSQDGRFLAWRGIMAGLRIAELGDEGIVSERLMETVQLHALHFDGEKKSLMAIGGENLYSLPLGGWQKEKLKVERLSKRPVWLKSLSSFEERQTWVDETHQVTFRTGYGTAHRYDPVSRTVLMPPGKVTGESNDNPLYISPSGRVVRIDTEKLEGYVPPARK